MPYGVIEGVILGSDGFLPKSVTIFCESDPHEGNDHYSTNQNSSCFF